MFLIFCCVKVSSDMCIMGKYEKALELKDSEFKLLMGITKTTANDMIVLLKQAYLAKHRRRGRHSKLSVEDMLTMALKYWRQYPTFFELGFEYGVAKSTAHDVVVWVEDVLIRSKKFSLPGKKVLLSDGSGIEVVLVDVTEQQIERPKKSKTDTIVGKRSGILLKR